MRQSLPCRIRADMTPTASPMSPQTAAHQTPSERQRRTLSVGPRCGPAGVERLEDAARLPVAGLYRGLVSLL
jgi:hypothetical protein